MVSKTGVQRYLASWEFFSRPIFFPSHGTTKAARIAPLPQVCTGYCVLHLIKIGAKVRPKNWQHGGWTAERRQWILTTLFDPGHTSFLPGTVAPACRSARTGLHGPGTRATFVKGLSAAFLTRSDVLRSSTTACRRNYIVQPCVTWLAPPTQKAEYRSSDLSKGFSLFVFE